jgi:phospholipase/carboxylesterase
MYEGRAWFPIDVAALEESMRTGKPREFSQLSSLEFNQVVEKMDEFLLELKNQYKKIIVGGFSQGAMCSSHVKTRDALILLSGVLFDEKKLSVDPLFSNLPVFQSHGKFDDLLAYQEGKKLNHWLLQNKAQVQFVEFGGGHEIPPMVLSELKKFIASID